jgi:hypothetical protein
MKPQKRPSPFRRVVRKSNEFRGTLCSHVYIKSERYHRSKK